MGCPSGYTDISRYPRLDPLPILPWDYDGSPCREAYNGTIEELWSAFVAAVDECPHSPEKPSCVLSSCVIAKYAAYVTAFNTAGNTYTTCTSEA